MDYHNKIIVNFCFPVTSEFVIEQIFDSKTMESVGPLLPDEKGRDWTWTIVPRTGCNMDDMVRNIEHHQNVEFAEIDRPGIGLRGPMGALLNHAKVRYDPIVTHNVTLEQLEQMDQDELKSLGFTDLECLRIQQQFDGKTSTPIPETDDAIRYRLRMQDLRNMNTFNPDMMTKKEKQLWQKHEEEFVEFESDDSSSNSESIEPKSKEELLEELETKKKQWIAEFEKSDRERVRRCEGISDDGFVRFNRQERRQRQRQRQPQPRQREQCEECKIDGWIETMGEQDRRFSALHDDPRQQHSCVATKKTSSSKCVVC